jgi:hypothetical protein
VYGAESIFCISCGFSIICCIRLCIPGELRSPDGRVLALLPPVPPVSPPAADQGFGRGSRFSCPCWGFVPSEKVHPFPHFILELTVQFWFLLSGNNGLSVSSAQVRAHAHTHTYSINSETKCLFYKTIFILNPAPKVNII